MSTLTFRPFPARAGDKAARPRTAERTTQRTSPRTAQRTARRSSQTLKAAAPVCYHLVWVSILVLLTMGICMLLSISMANGVRGEASGQGPGVYYYVSRQGIVAVVGLALMFGVMHFDYRRLRKLSLLFLGFVAVSLLAVHIPGIGHKVNGASSYIGIGPLSYQPSEYAKLAVVLAGAHLMSTPRVKDGRFLSYVLPFGAAGVVLSGLVALENDFGTAMIIIGLVLGLLWLAGMKSKEWLLLTGGGALVGVGVMMAAVPNKVIARLGAMINPWADPQGTGYQLKQSLLALGRGGWFGVGPGRSVQKFDYLPEAHNDMIYAILGEEFGFMGAAAVIALFAAFAIACWRLARRCADPMGKYLIAGCAMIITLQAAINIGGVIGAIPLTGVPLPFVSYGCNSLVVMLVAVGLILAVARRASALTAPSPAKRNENVKRVDSRRGTAGHVVPALALADVLSQRGLQVAFCGTERGMEKDLVPRAGYALSTVRIRGFERKLGVSTLQTLAYIPVAAYDAFKVLREVRPDCVIGVGSHASGPVVAEAALRGIPTVAVEMDSHMGWTNRILSKLVDRVCLSYADEAHKGSKFVLTGRPLRPALLSATKEQGLARFGLAADRPTLLVFGGSLGAHSLNVAVLEAFSMKQTPFQVVHVTGELDYAWVVETLGQPTANQAYQAHAFLDDLPLALAAADAVVARAGGSVAEMLARGLPALLVPYPYAAGDHQAKNARRVAEAGAAVVVANADLDAKRVSDAVARLLDPEVNKRMRQAALALAVPDAADRIAEVVVELVARRAG